MSGRWRPPCPATAVSSPARRFHRRFGHCGAARSYERSRGQGVLAQSATLDGMCRRDVECLANRGCTIVINDFFLTGLGYVINVYSTASMLIPRTFV